MQIPSLYNTDPSITRTWCTKCTHSYEGSHSIQFLGCSNHLATNHCDVAVLYSCRKFYYDLVHHEILQTTWWLQLTNTEEIFYNNTKPVLVVLWLCDNHWELMIPFCWSLWPRYICPQPILSPLCLNFSVLGTLFVNLYLSTILSAIYWVTEHLSQSFVTTSLKSSCGGHYSHWTI